MDTGTGGLAERVTRPWRRLPVTGQDTVLAVALTAAMLPGGPQGWVPWLLTVAGCAPLVLRRRCPMSVAVAVGAVAFTTNALLWINDPLTILLAGFAAGSAAYHRGSVPWLLVLSALWMLGYVLVDVPEESMGPDPLWGIAVSVAIAMLPVIVGYLLRLRAESAEHRFRMMRVLAQQERARERARIARDVHDIAGHHLSAIRLLAVGGRQALGGSSQEVDAILGSIADASGRAVREVRELLQVLRDDRLDEPPPPDVRLDDLTLLVQAMDGTGVDVDLVLPPGGCEGLPRRVRADAYRIVQEALGNVLRHSSARRVLVRLSPSAEALAVTVEDDGAPPPEREPAGSGGLGIRGMRERAAESGGRVEAGFLPGRGWRVRAVLPLSPEPPENAGNAGDAGDAGDAGEGGT